MAELSAEMMKARGALLESDIPRIAPGILFGGPTVDAFPEVTTDVPTLTWGAAQTVSGHVISVLSDEIRLEGRQGFWNPTFGYQDVGAQYSAISFVLDGDSVEIGFTEQTANQSAFWLWVDGRPVTALPTGPGTSTSTGANYFLKIAFATSKRRRIEIHTKSIKAWISVGVPLLSSLTKTQPKGILCVVGDSFCDGSASSPGLSAVGLTVARLLGMELVLASVGGTGYVSGSETFGSEARLSKITERRPDIIMVMGSVNDDAFAASVGAAASAFFAELDSRLPGVPIVVFGPQPSNATDTVAASRLNNRKAVKSSAVAATNVVAYHDMVGAEDAASYTAWSGSTTYNHGDIASYQGSIYQLDNPGGTSLNQPPVGQRRWKLLTWLYTGTGRVGGATGNGNRDVLLSSDALHPEVAGSTAFALRAAAEIRSDFKS